MTCRLTVVHANLLAQTDCDAIVNSANQNLRAGSGVCGAIYRAAGPQLEPCSIRQAPLELGKAVITPGFALQNRFVIHVRGPRYLFDPSPEKHLFAAMRNLIRLAEMHTLKSIAVPAISMGIYRYPPEEAIPVLLTATKSLLPTLVSLEEIRFAVIDEHMFRIFCKLMDTGITAS